jgi:hypothetical protein
MRLTTLVRTLGFFAVILSAASARPAQSPQSTTASPQVQAAGEAPKLPDELTLQDGTKAERTTPKPGDICVSCNHPVDEHDAVFLVRGRRLPIHLGELRADLGAQLTELAGRLEPQSALFQVSESNPARAILWLLGGSYVLMALIFAGLSSQRALKKGYSPSAWLALGLLFHVFAYAVLLALPGRNAEAPAGIPSGIEKAATANQPVPCPCCGKLNDPSVPNCADCGGTLVARVSSKVARAGL